jgi:hypothetical protein
MMVQRISTAFFLTAALLMLSFSSTGGSPCPKAKKEMKKSLSRLSFDDLYAGTEQEPVHELWKKAGSACALHSLMLDTKQKPQLRFMAAEIFLENSDSLPPDSERVQLGILYTLAIRENFTGEMNSWGMRDTASVDYTGEHLVRIGTPAIPALKTLLDTPEARHYSGSKSAEMAEAWGYRVKDIAAFYILKILHRPFDGWTKSRTERDALIEQLKKELAGY